MWSDETTDGWDGREPLQDADADSALDPTVEELPELSPLDALAPAEATDILSAPDLPPAELDVEPRFGATSTVTADSDAEEFKYLNSTGDYRGLTTNREIDPWTGTEKK